MLRFLSAYYSRSGHTAAFARAIAEELSSRGVNVDEVRVSTAGKMSFVLCGFQALVRARPPIVPSTLDASGYDVVLLGFPVWAGRPASPFNSVVAGLTNARGRRFGLFATCGMTGGHRNALDLATKDIDRVGGVVLYTVGLSERQTSEMAAVAADFVGKIMNVVRQESPIPPA